MSTDITNPTCYQLNNRFASAIPGNIGTVRAQVIVWDHDPFMARPHVNLTFPFNQQAGREETNEKNVEFIGGALSLKPIYVYESTTIRVLKVVDNIPEAMNVYEFVGDLQSGDAGPNKDYLPGGSKFVGVYEVNHDNQVWDHIGSLFRSSPTLLPSEYSKSLDSTKYWSENNGKTDEQKQKELQGAVKWRVTEEKDGVSSTFWPYQITKQAPSTQAPVHWSLEKLKPVFQGCDFHISIHKGDKELDYGVDPCLQEDEYGQLNLLCQEESVDPGDPQYGCLFYKYPGNWNYEASPFVQGITNEPYTYPLPENASKEDISSVEAYSRRDFWWMYKPYFVIEIGPYSTEHNYLIEIVSGRSPRLIHIGWEWDHPDRLINPNIFDSNDGWRYMLKSRVLSVYDTVVSDALLSMDKLRIAVKNQLGKLIIRFEGHEDTPWIITRSDRIKNDWQNYEPKPMVVPNDVLIMHGGNISCKLNFSVTKYAESAEIIYDNISVSTGKATDENLYITLAEMDDTTGENRPTSNIMDSHFNNDKKIGPSTMRPTVDSDVHTSYEYIQNRPGIALKVYEKFRASFEDMGRGFGYKVIKKDGTSRISTQKTPIHIQKPHTVVFTNNKKLRPFTLVQTDPALKDFDYKNYSANFTVGVRLNAGSAKFEIEDEDETSKKSRKKKYCIVSNCITPIVTQWRFLLTGGEKPTEGIKKLDITPLVANLTDRWTAEEFSSLTHEATLKCYLPIGIPMGTPLTSKGKDISLLALAQSLWKLHNKAFYVTIKYWWETGIGIRMAVGNALNGPEPPELDPTLIQMTGIAYGAEFEKSVNKLYMNIKVKDYMDVFKKQPIFNSPFFDGVSDTLAVYELAKMAGFDDEPPPHFDPLNDPFNRFGTIPKIDRRPLGYLQKVLEYPAQENYWYNGVQTTTRPYDLPMAYSDLANPAMRFQNGETFEAAFKKITQLASKTIYFDQFGVLKYENIPAYEVAFLPPNTAATRYPPIYKFVTSPHVNIPPSPTDGGGSYLNDGFIFNPSIDAAKLVYNVITYGRSVEDCINTIVVMTASKNIYGIENIEEAIGGYIVEGHTFMEQIWDPTSEGFFGFRKPIYQSNGVFGGLREARKVLFHYAKMKYPIAYITFETYGVPSLKALDVITLDNELFYITDISHDINPQENKWWMTIQGEWLKPFRGDTSVFSEPDIDVIGPPV